MISTVVLATAAAACSLAQPGSCIDTKALLSDPGVAAEIRRLVIFRRASLLYGREARDAPVADQLLAVLGGSPDKRVQFGHYYLFSACRLHRCEEKGALLISDAGILLGAAILYTGCGAGGAPICDTADRRMAAYIAGPIPSDVQDKLVSWAAAVAGGRSLSQMHVERVTSVPTAISLDFDGDGRRDRVRLERQGTGGRLIAYRGAQPDRGIVIRYIKDPGDFDLRGESLAKEGAGGSASLLPTQKDIVFRTPGERKFVAHWNGLRFLTNQVLE